MQPSVLTAEPKGPSRKAVLAPLLLLAILGVAFGMTFGWLRAGFPMGPSIFRKAGGHQENGGAWSKIPAPTGFVQALGITGSGTVWAQTWAPAGFSRWNGKSWQRFAETDAGTKTTFSEDDFAIDGESIWATFDRDVLHWTGDHWEKFAQAIPHEAFSIVAGGGECWTIDVEGNLSHFDGTRWRSQHIMPSHKITPPQVQPAKPDAHPESADDDPGDDAFPHLARTSDGTLWLLWWGLWRIEGPRLQPVSDGEDRLTDSAFIGAAGDRLWLPAGNGIRSVSADGKFKRYTPAEIGLSRVYFSGEIVARDGRTWFTTPDGIIEFDGSHWSKTPFPMKTLGIVQKIAVAPDGSLWVLALAPQAAIRSFRNRIYLSIGLLLAIVGVGIWIFWRLRKREMERHQRVANAVLHATGEIPEELRTGGRLLSHSSHWGEALIGLVSIVTATVGYVILRHYWHNVPRWTILALAIAIHVAITFEQSLVKRKPMPYDPIGPGAPPKYDWGKSWKAIGGALFVFAILYADRLPGLGFLHGRAWWVLILAPTAYKALMIHFYAKAMKRGDYEGALNVVRWFHFYNPYGTDALRMSGVVYLLAGRYREAEEALRQSLASSRAGESYGTALEHLGDALTEQGRYDEATRSYQAALQAFPWRRRPHRGLAEMLLRQGRNADLALESIEKVIDFSDLSARQRKLNGNTKDDYWALKAWALGLKGRSSEVPEAIENALKVTNTASRTDMASANYRFGMAMRALGNSTAAEEYFRKAVEFDPRGRRGMLAAAALESAMRGVRA